MAQNKKRLVQVWLPLLPAVVAVLLLAMVLWLVDRTVGEELVRRAHQRVAQTGSIYADQVSRVLAQRAGELELMAGLPALGLGVDDLRMQLTQLRRSSPAYVWIGATDSHGKVIAGSDGLLEGRDIGKRPVYLEGIRGLWFGSLHPPLALVDPLRSRQLPVPRELADIAQPYKDAQGERGVLAAHMDGAYFDRLRASAVGPSLAQRGMQVVLVESNGALLLGEAPGLSPEQTQQLMAAPAGVPATYVVDGDQRVMVTRVPIQPVDSRLRADWQVFAWQPLAQVLAPVRELQRLVTLVAGALALGLGIAGFWLSRRLAQPYSDLLDVVAQRASLGGLGGSGETLRAVTEQLRLLPSDEPHSRSEQTLARVLQDASRLQAVVDHLPAPVYLVDMGLHITYWNRAAERVFGWSAGEAMGRHVGELFRDRTPSDERERLRRDFLVSPGPWLFTANMLRRDGTDMWGEWRLTKLLDADGAALGIIAQVRDMTVERQSEQRLREQGEVLAGVINGASDAVISVNMQGRITLFNPAAERIFGRAAGDMLGQPLERLLPPAYRNEHAGLMKRFADSQSTSRRMGFGRVQGVHADGALLELEASISQVTVRGEKLLTAILRDVTARVRDEQALARYQLELSELTQRLLHQEQVTTRELAQTLHDQLGQTLGAIRLSYDALGGVAQQHLPAAAFERAQIVGRQIDQAIAEVRQALVKLRPPLLEEMGLVAAIDNDVQLRAPEAEPVRLEFVNLGDTARVRWPEDVEYAAFMVVREAVANALQHAQASYVLVRVDGDPDRLRLDVVDDGVGLADGMALGRPGHLGIVGMRERALAIGARLSARRRQSGGTRVTLIWTSNPDQMAPDRDELLANSTIF
ncbi:MAG: PAS domain S-box protein [Hydrogenophaga sp.]|uniref:PAS domain-containing sensor histidine kinase n=1 Tax=Hydrogenophaga sp. TaxID=1904254 RepID=UPI001D3FCD60|nr:PAS domain S-box protein [Hydrogenophaga sp.]MBX3608788.1 PAS domain S-box protein [Hydrogenophaga sp.]